MTRGGFTLKKVDFSLFFKYETSVENMHASYKSNDKYNKLCFRQNIDVFKYLKLFKYLFKHTSCHRFDIYFAINIRYLSIFECFLIYHINN